MVNFIREHYENLCINTTEVLSVFESYFGKEFVDLQQLPSISQFTDTIMSASYDDIVNNVHDIDANIITDLQEYINNGNSSYLSDPFIFDKLKQAVKYASNTLEYQIIVYIPKATVVNERDSSIDIFDVYIKVPMFLSGLMAHNFTLCRATYPISQWAAGYRHSHTTRFRDTASAKEFSNCCLGSGPIVDTIIELRIAFDEVKMGLFCHELKMYVDNESISGGPYIRMSEVNSPTSRVVDRYNTITLRNRSMPDSIENNYGLFNEFVSYLITNKLLSFNFVNGCYSLATNFIDTTLLLSNAFIDFFNLKLLSNENLEGVTIDYLYASSVLVKGRLDSQKESIELISTRGNNVAIPSRNGSYMFMFKDKPVSLNVIEDTVNLPENLLTILNRRIIEFIVATILRNININYGTYETHIDYTSGTHSGSFRIEGSYKAIQIGDRR